MISEDSLPGLAPDNEEKLSFEEALNRLEKLVSDMENQSVPLEEMIKQYEEGQKLATFCRSKLSVLEEKIMVLTSDDGASGQWSDFAPGTDRVRDC